MVQVQSRVLVMAMLPDPPADGKEPGEVVAASAHRVALGAASVVEVDVQPATQKTRALIAIAARRTWLRSANCLPLRPAADFAPTEHLWAR